MKKKYRVLIVVLVAVLMLQGSVSAKPLRHHHKAYEMTMDEQKKDIVETAMGDARLKTLVEALKSADLVNTLKSAGPFTVFAPTDEAFAKLPAGTLQNLLKPENKEKLADVLKYHVALEKLPASDLSKMSNKEITMANGDKAKIEVKDGSVFINNARVIVKDVMASNGIIHIIDMVILPPN